MDILKSSSENRSNKDTSPLSYGTPAFDDIWMAQQAN
jgi:hypothetical protein